MNSNEVARRVSEALSELPAESGGLAVVLATAGRPPAMALLSSGDVHVSGGVARVGIYASSSTVTRLGGAFTLLIPLGEIAARVEVESATATEVPPLALLEGDVTSIRPTSEPPWVLQMGFVPEPRDHPLIPDYVDYWRQVKAWLKGEQAEPPPIPH